MSAMWGSKLRVTGILRRSSVCGSDTPGGVRHNQVKRLVVGSVAMTGTYQLVNPYTLRTAATVRPQP